MSQIKSKMYNKFKKAKRKTAFTLLEVLIATAVTLLLMLGLSQIFKVLGNSITKGRAGLELNNRLRGVVHRVRTDLDNLTTTPIPPIKVGTAQGYMKYYDGPGSDATFASDPMLNRFGDIDDVFQATIKAQDSWFTGKVPRFIVDSTITPSAADSNGNFVPDCLEDLVTISSQYAELVIFAEPVATTRTLPVAEPLSDNPSKDPIRLAAAPAPGYLAAEPVGGYEDSLFGGDGFPDSFKLHYRLLLIRPDLNLASGLLPGVGNATDPRFRVLVAGEEVLTPEFQIEPPPLLSSSTIVPQFASANRINLPTPLCDMWRIHQYCDLSIRRVHNSLDGLPGSHDYVAANSLEDLANPINRFAHFYQPLGTDFQSMPILALARPMQFQTDILSPPPIGQHNLTPRAAPFHFCAGFLHPVYSLLGKRVGEDVIASNLLAFDVRAFDPSAPLITHIAGNVVLRPGDPGYVSLGLSNLGTPLVVQEGSGEFVDLNWAGKAGTTYASEFALGTANSVANFTAAIKKSGLVKFDSITPTAVLSVFQPSFDTFSDLYERDAVFQAQNVVNGGLADGGVAIFPSTFVEAGWRGNVIDAGNDGIDNNSDGYTDDLFEKETSPPFASHLRGIQITIRLEDSPTKQFKQMSTVKEFVTK